MSKLWGNDSVVEKSIDTLKPYENNPRRKARAVEAVANSIKEFGFKVPIVIDADNIVVAGHTRLEACKKLGMKKVFCVVADDLTDQQIKAFRIADNKVSEVASWDYEKLENEVRKIDLDMTKFGLEQVTLDDIDLDKILEKTLEKGKVVICPICGEKIKV